MTSFAVAIEPATSPRLAAAVLLAHAVAAAGPWLARVPPLLAVPITLLALAGFALSIARLSGPHCALAALRLDARGCRVRLRGAQAFEPAALGPGSRAYPMLAYLDVRLGSRRCGWLLSRDCVPHDQFRRLKARVRLSC